MMTTADRMVRQICGRRRQAGGITIFSAVLILILLTEMVLYAVQTGVFEQRKSSNELRQKVAFHKADSAIQQAKQYMLRNSGQVVKSIGTGAWMAAGTSDQRWYPCAGATSGTKGAHPCFAESATTAYNGTSFRDGSYFFGIDADSNDAITLTEAELPLDPDALGTSDPTDRVELYAILCMFEVDRSQDPIVRGCTTDAAKQDNRYYMITLLSRGQADCDGNGANCSAEALVSEKIGSFGPGAGEGGPAVPLTARTNVPLSGTVEIVPNPNGGGEGVPISSWVNLNQDPACRLSGDPISPISGSYATCERHEWYGTSEFPSDYKCPTNNCSCSKNDDRLLTYAQGNNREMGIDIVPDPNFPCDLWLYTFGIPKARYVEVRDAVVPIDHRLTSCDSLDSDSAGVYWITGASCDIKTQIGSAENPVLLISLVANTKITAGAEIFGVLFVSDAANANAEFTGNGHGTVYGAAVMDAVMEHFNGTFQVVYLENLIRAVTETGAFGNVAGGWADFHDTWE
ncbi:pilus assembly PilX family protein [Elongatibacter sediminis]|uniref:Type 4 fimbrial biogenesis protein PilX N-terminal domain-containing protein n=1 Tax=Elongatibacter sediminis TaxID=3119006 RepID=A0AAW9R6G3_9GAMM